MIDSCEDDADDLQILFYLHRSLAMAIDDNSDTSGNKIEEKNTDLAIPVQAARVYDSVNGKSCHQCRQMTKEFAPSCKRLKKDKPCPLTFCPKCLDNRYGEKLEEPGKLEDWICPKCRGVCNCSCCRKSKGLQPTGILAPKAKARGFNSVLHFLDNKGAKVLEPQNECIEQKHAESSEEGIPKMEGKGSKRLKIKDHSESKEDIVLPQGRPLTEVASIELLAQDIGANLQLLEFCNAFSEILDIKIGQPERTVQDIFRGPVERHEVHSALVEFHINLRSLIEKDYEKEHSFLPSWGDAWLKILKRYTGKSKCNLDELPVDFLDRVSSGYDNLEASGKLKILNFLCDEVVATEKLRKRIHEVAAKCDEDRKKTKKKLLLPRKRKTS